MLPDLLEPGQSLSPGQECRVYIGNRGYVVRQREGYHEWFTYERAWKDDPHFSFEAREPGIYTEPRWQAPKGWIVDKADAEAWACVEKAHRERPVSHERPYRDTYSVRDGFTFNNQSGEYIETSFKQRRPL